MDYYFEFQTAVGSFRWPALPTSPYAYVVGRAAVLYREDFESGFNGWTHAATMGVDDWEIGTPQGLAGDPSAAASGNACVGTDLSLDGAYEPLTASRLQSPVLPTAGRRDVFLRYRRHASVNEGARDRLSILVNNLPAWSNGSTRKLLDRAWTTHVLDISFLLTISPFPRISFALTSDATDQRGGWNIDDVELFYWTDCVAPLRYGQATPGTGLQSPELEPEGEPHVGNQGFALRARSLRGSVPAILILSAAPFQAQVAGIDLLVDPASAALVSARASGASGVPGVGEVTFVLPIPANLALDDADVFTQVLTLDPAGPAGLASSQGVRVRVCRIAP